MIEWPCMFKLDGDYELLYVPSQDVLESELTSLIWSEDDWLIDSRGRCFLISTDEQGYHYQPLGEPITLEQVTQWVQEHEFAKVEVCLTKIHFTSIQQAIESLSAE